MLPKHAPAVGSNRYAIQLGAGGIQLLGPLDLEPHQVAKALVAHARPQVVGRVAEAAQSSCGR